MLLTMGMATMVDSSVDPFSEELAYLIGDIGFNMFPLAKKFLCEHCREEL